MMMSNHAGTCIAAATLLMSASALHAGENDRPVEISEDGRTVATIADQSAGNNARGGNAPIFPDQPDWVNSLRRQVGAVAVVDMNDDGLLDVVAGVYHTNSFPPYDDWHNLIYYNVGGELEAEPSWVSTDEVSTGSIAVADFNGDGHPDVFACNGVSSSSDSVIYFGSADGPSESPGWFSNEPNTAWNNYALPIDIDQDGDMDLVTANQGYSPDDPYRPMFVFYNDNGSLETTPSWQSPVPSIQGYLDAGDLDSDGWDDIGVTRWSGFETAVYRNNNGTPQTPPVWTIGDEDTDKGIAWADIDGDGDDDLAVGKDPTRLYENNGGTLNLIWEADESLFFGHNELKFADVDDDGDPDLVEVHFSSGATNIYLNDNGSFPTLPSWVHDPTEFLVGTAVGFGDINGDGRTDLVIGHAGEPSIKVFYGLETACPADTDGSGAVGVNDLLGLLGAWGTDNATYDLAPDGGDGTVGIADLLFLLGEWGPC